MVTAKGSSVTKAAGGPTFRLIAAVVSLLTAMASMWDGPHLHHWDEATWELVLSALLSKIADRQATDV